jgi:hypothetical protein
MPQATPEFLRIFMPYELRLAQRRAMVWGSIPFETVPNTFVGIFLIRLEPAQGSSFPAQEEGGDSLGEHVQGALREVLRDSDIPGILSDQEHLAIARDVDPQYAYVVAQRMLSTMARSLTLRATALRVRVGYVVYPLSTQPNFPTERWSTLVDMARGLSQRGDPTASASGNGVLRGPQMADAGIPESDLVPLFLRDPDSLVDAGLLQIQRIRLLPAV